VGTTLLFENDSLRVWDITLEPGERVPFHCHSRPYLWICRSGGSSAYREPDGSRAAAEHRVGDTRWHGDLSPDNVLIHDFENVGTTTLTFIAVELPPDHAAERNPR
jgi:beta-alanine degradation protein BauB